MSSIDSMDIYSNDGMVEKLSVAAFQKLLRIENRLNIKARGHFIQSRVEFSHLIELCIRVCVRSTNSSVLTFLTNIAFNALHVLIFVSTVSINMIPYITQNSIALILCIDQLDMPFNVHTTDKVTMDVNEWLPHYLIQSRSHCNSNFKLKRVLIRRNIRK